ncbi:dihydroorotase [Paracoccidioides lutzii Pb01]|uniref:dihydroorotase n=1 Tax=Paracoccidioides lutzii (strain ATCC MYA-826 / Pb01) TaxID=502779 RepID=C1H637_PARBA|nr:dihydroorotase [Paracoccidioides lutzii Pb01]EEH35100.2 dihydroorotase [Paracoccidioides lutzii Pb01]
MPLSKFDGIKLPASADFHVHLRDGDMMELVVPTIRQGGVNTVYVMPNLVPPITTVSQALSYKKRLQALEPRVTFLMSLYLHPSITPETIIEAKKSGITGVKSYPAGVTTNSDAGVIDYAAFYPVFAEMERQGLILNLHGECPSHGDITVMSAEERFLPTLLDLHSRFPRLRIIVEHLSTAAAVETVKECGPTVVGTITAHHLSLIVDNAFGDPFSFCKPVAKLVTDRDALLRAATSGSTKFFFGSDSAPHSSVAKRGGDKIAAGVFTQPYATQYVLDAFEKGCESGVLKEEDITKTVLESFLGRSGREFYGIEQEEKEFITLKRRKGKILDVLKSEKTDVVPFRKGEETWALSWE